MFSALIFLRPRPPVLGGGPSRPVNPMLFLIDSVPEAPGSPEARFEEDIIPWRTWLIVLVLDAEVMGLPDSEVFWFWLREDSAKQEKNILIYL